MRYDWELEELVEIHNMPMLDLVFEAARVHREHHLPREIQWSHLISVKTGGCSEDCGYCAQSRRHSTTVKAEPMMLLDEALSRARRAQEEGATRVCLGAAWRQIRDNEQFERLLEMIKGITALGLEVCCSTGMVAEHQAKRLKEAGLYAYNHNLDSSEEFYETIITTRKYSERLETLGVIRDAGMTMCSGGIIGLGETVEDRLKMLQTLSSFKPHPESVPINRLVPIAGTALGDRESADAWEVIRMVATARIIMPKSMVRLAAGRETLSDAEQGLCFLAGANSIFMGEKLLTVPNADIEADKKLLKTLGLELREPSKAASL